MSNNYGKIAHRFRRRGARLAATNKALMNDIRKRYFFGLQNATEAELYKRTPLPVTYTMFSSIFSRVAKSGNELTFGYDLRKCYYAVDRLNMKGYSILGKHLLDMDPGAYIRKYVDPVVHVKVNSWWRKTLSGKA